MTGDSAPAKCIKCGAPAEKFAKLEGRRGNWFERSRRTNMLNTRHDRAGREIEGVCKEGIADALDPGCVDVFTKTLNASYDMMKLSMTRWLGHRQGQVGQRTPRLADVVGDLECRTARAAIVRCAPILFLRIAHRILCACVTSAYRFAAACLPRHASGYHPRERELAGVVGLELVEDRE